MILPQSTPPLILFVPSYDLPDDVFGPGEIKPTRPRKKTANKKRPVDASGLEVCYCSSLKLF